MEFEQILKLIERVSESKLDSFSYEQNGTKLRLEKAIELLNTTDMNLQEISGACGFAESNYFSKVFRKYMKASPGKFRKHVQREGYVNVQI